MIPKRYKKILTPKVVLSLWAVLSLVVTPIEYVSGYFVQFGFIYILLRILSIAVPLIGLIGINLWKERFDDLAVGYVIALTMAFILAPTIIRNSSTYDPILKILNNITMVLVVMALILIPVVLFLHLFLQSK
ncbi:MAG: hypothetical protein QXE01_06765 [Sulfolobales archaeon]